MCQYCARQYHRGGVAVVISGWCGLFGNAGTGVYMAAKLSLMWRALKRVAGRSA